ncbi:MAG: diguanylate cyclase [Desulfosalsimonadaceae bacterium]
MKFQKLLYFLQNVGRDPSSLMQEDYLTGLKNRRFLLHYLKYAVNWDSIAESPVSLLVVDIDYFKRINEQYGSGVGDQALVHVAGILKQVSGKTGIPILSAGDEFMVLLPGMKKQGALILASELIAHAAANQFFSSDAGTQIPITLSVGAATAPDDAGTASGLIGQTKNALQHAKASGRNQYVDAGIATRQAVQYLEGASIVGRKSQFEGVAHALKSVENGISRFVIVDGAAGMGKTSFLDVVQRNLNKSGFHTVRVSGVVQESFRPYYLMSYIVMALMNQREDKGIEILEEMGETDLEHLACILPQIGETDIKTKEIDEQRREAIFRSFIRFFIALADGGRLALLIDDLDYSDPASLHLLRIMMMEKSVVMFVCATATEDAKTKPKAIPLELFRSAYSETLSIQTVRLTPLTAGEIEKHIHIIFPGIEIPTQLSRELAGISQGNPLFIEELLRKMITDQKIVQSGQHWKVTKLEKGYFPKSLEDIIRNKLMTLDSGSQRFLDCASAFGESISLSMLTSVSDEKSALVHDFLNRVIDQGIVRADFNDNDETIRFLSKRIQNAVYDRIHPDQKKNLHEQIGNYQEKLYKHNLLPSAAFLAHHYKQSENQEKARMYEDLQSGLNHQIFSDREVARYRVNGDDEEGAGEAALGDVPLSATSRAFVPKLLQSLLIAIRNIRLYPPESKSVVNSIDMLRQLVERVLEDTDRLSIITEKNSLVMNGQVLEVGNFQSIAQTIIDFWDRLQLSSLTFVKGFTEAELKIVLERICRIEPKEITPRFWKAFTEDKQLKSVVPRQVRYKKIQASADDAVPGRTGTVDRMDAEISAAFDQGFGDQDMLALQRIISALLGASSKMKLYPAQGPVARQSLSLVMEALAPFFETRPALTLARIDTSLLVNGIRLDTSGFETMAAGMVRFLGDAGLNSITFLNSMTETELSGFIVAAGEPLEGAEGGGEFWKKFATEKQIHGILFNQRVYGIHLAAPGAGTEAAGTSADVGDAGPEVLPEPEEDSIPEVLDFHDIPDQLKKRYLSGDMNGAGVLVQQLCDRYKASDQPGKKDLLDIFEAILQPPDWRPGASYLTFTLSHAMPLFEGEEHRESNRRAAALLYRCAEELILLGDYTPAAWVFDQIGHMAKAGGEAPGGSDPLLDKPMDSRIVEAIIEDLKSEDRLRRQEAFQLLSTLGQGIVPALIETLKREGSLRVRRMIAELIKNQGEEGVDVLKRSLMSESRPEFRARLVDVIDAVTPDVMLELSDTLSDASDVVRRSAFRLAERLNTSFVIDLMIELAGGDDPDVAIYAIGSLGNLKARQAADTLIRIAEQTEAKETLAAVCRAMGQIADPAFVTSLENILLPRRRLFFQKKTDLSVRVAALYAASQIHDPRVKPMLMVLADDPDSRIREVVKNLRTI